jgi:hypothetical protein
LSGVADPARIRPNERPNPADILTQVGALLVVVLALALVAQVLVGARRPDKASFPVSKSFTDSDRPSHVEVLVLALPARPWADH